MTISLSVSLLSLSLPLSLSLSPSLQFQEACLSECERRKEAVKRAREESAQQTQAYYLRCLHQLVNGEREGAVDATFLLRSHDNVHPEAKVVLPTVGETPSAARSPWDNPKEPVDSQQPFRHHHKPELGRTDLHKPRERVQLLMGERKRKAVAGSKDPTGPPSQTDPRARHRARTKEGGGRVRVSAGAASRGIGAVRRGGSDGNR